MWFSIQPKPGFGIKNRKQDQISVSVSELKHFSKPETFFFNFPRFLKVLVNTNFKSLKINPELQK